MTYRLFTLVALAVMLGAAGPPAAAVTSPSGIDSRLRLDWEIGQTRSGQPLISGYIYNDYGRAANNVRFLVETLDPSGRIIDRTLGFVPGSVPVFGRRYFDVPLKRPGASYRITVTAFEWRAAG